MTYCTGPRCGRTQVAAGFCRGHYQQHWRGKPLQPLRSDLTIEERLLAARRIDARGCWLWTRSVDTAGYGRMKIEGRLIAAHRAAYETWIGPADKQVVHHKCSVHHCINPAHLELASVAENTLEMLERRSLRTRIAELEAEVSALRAEIARRDGV